MFELKKYQQRVLQRLQEFFTAVLTDDVITVFSQVAHVKDESDKKENPYAREYEIQVENLENCPHICVRIPTGGGKTFMAANSLKILQDYRMAANPNMHPAPAVLWIVPSDSIRKQTTEMLTNPAHSCRQTINEIFGKEIRILDIEDFDNLTMDDITVNGFIIVSTAAMFRVRQTARNNAATRRIYASHENFYAHFSSLLPNPPPPPEAGAAGLHLEYNEDNHIKHSFANLLHLLNPIVVCDEAHNFISDLSQEVLRRINPSCIMEWTATPRNTQNTQRHNLLVSASAQELKDEEMIKLPLIVSEHDDWEKAIQGAVLERESLAKIAATDRQVRPIVLYKAEQNRGDAPVTVDILKKHLIEEHNINETEIAIATGKIHDLNDIDLLSPNCPINHIITIEALREGWDCSFAYIFCSVDNIQSETAIEQFLGRIMRMPFAKKHKAKELNCAYVHLPAEHASAAAEVIRQKLSLHLGFDEQEAQDMVRFREENLLGDGSLFEQNFNVQTEQNPDFSSLPEEEQKEVEQAIDIKQNPPEIGGFTANITAPISPQAQDAIIAAVTPQNQPQQRQRLRHAMEQHAIAKSPAKQGEKFADLPQLIFCPPECDEEIPLSTKTLYEVAEWNDLGEDFILSQFHINETGNVFKIQLQSNKMQTVRQGVYTLPFSVMRTTRPQLVNWLKTKIRDPEGRFSSEMLGELINKNLDFFINQNKQTIEQLARAKYQLANELRAWLNKHIKRISDATTKQFLFENEDLKCNYLSYFLPDYYPCGDKLYNGRYRFSKHYYGKIGELDNEEETACAKAIDISKDVKHWIRNMGRQKGSYFLPLDAKYNFYPDFIVELNNGKFLIVEYKGAHLLADSQRKKRVGEQLERVTCGKCFFAMVSKPREQDMSAIYKQVDQKIKEIMEMECSE